jgi:hypothetical protein
MTTPSPTLPMPSRGRMMLTRRTLVTVRLPLTPPANRLAEPAGR